MQKNNILDNLLFVTESDYQCTLSQLYHENSKVGRKKYEFDSISAPNALMTNLTKIVNGKGKDYSFHKTLDINFAKPIEPRRSKRFFNNQPIVQDVMHAILNNLLAYPTEENNYRRAYPSAGGLYPIEMYPIVINVENCQPGLYYLDSYKHQLMELQLHVNIETIKRMFMDDEAILNAGLIILMTAVLPRLQFKYGERAYRYAHLEAGHVAQIILQQCHKNKIAAFPVGGFIEREIEEYLDIDGHEEIALYSIVIGQTNDY